MPFSKPLNVPETRIVWRSGTHDDPYVDRSDVLKIINGTVILHEIPDDFNHVFIDGYSEVFKEAPLSNQFVVDYQNGYIFFNASEEGKTITANYKGKGVVLYPAQRIYIQNENPEITISLQEVIDTYGSDIEKISTITDLDVSATLKIIGWKQEGGHLILMYEGVV